MSSNVLEKVTSALNLLVRTKVSELQALVCALANNVEADEVAHFQATFTPALLDKGTACALRISPFMRRRKVLTAENLSDAVRGCDTYAKSKVVFGPMALGWGFFVVI
jgi:hypothetical protein